MNKNIKKININHFKIISLSGLALLTCSVFNQNPDALASTFGGELTPNVTNALRNGIGTIIGYSDATQFSNLACGGATDTSSCQGPPQAGIVGTLVSIVNGLKTVAKNGGISTCTGVPSSGSVTASNSSGVSTTLNFKTPTHTIPTAWTGGGTLFSKRVEVSTSFTLGGENTPIGIAYEFNCGDSAATYTAVSMTVGSHAPNYSRDIAVYSGPVTSIINGMQVFMAEWNRADITQIRGSYAVDIQYNPITSIFNLWGVISNQLSFADNSSSGLDFLMKVNANGNYSTSKALVFASLIGQDTGSYGKFDSPALTLSQATNANLETDPGNTAMGTDLTSSPLRQTGSPSGLATAGSPQTAAYQACVDFANSSTANAPSHTNCSGFTLTAPADTTPAIDASGNWSINWATTIMGNKLEQLTIPSS